MIAYRDCAFIHLTRTETELYWSDNDTCVNSATAYHNTYAEPWTNWYRTYYDDSQSRQCAQARGNTIAHFKNPTFCATLDTYTYHDKTQVTGYIGGSGNWERTMSKSGTCSGLLHTTYAWTPRSGQL